MNLFTPTQPGAPSVARPECVDCGHTFHPDSTPHFDRCWECAERADEQPDTREGLVSDLVTTLQRLAFVTGLIEGLVMA